MKIEFHEYIGLAGDPHVLLIGETEDGRKESVLINRCHFRRFNRWRGERKITRRLRVKSA